MIRLGGKVSISVATARILGALFLGALLLVADGSSKAAAKAAPDGDAAMVRIPGNVLPALAMAKLAPDQTAASAKLTITLTLNRDDQAGFERNLHALYNPHSPKFHRFLTQREIADRFGPSRGDYGAVISYLRANGFHIVKRSINRLTVTARGTRTDAERAFGVRIADYRIGKQTFHANDIDPALPRDLAPMVEAISGLSNYAQPKPGHIAIFSSVCAIEIGLLANFIGLDPNTANGKACILGMLASCINSNANAAGYGTLINAQIPACQLFPGLDKTSPARGTTANLSAPTASPSPWYQSDGAGQTIGLVEFDNFNSSDVSDYLNLAGLPATEIGNLSEVNVDGGASIGPGEDEVLLDIDTVMTVAHGARVVVYDAPFTGAGGGFSGGSFQDVLNQMIDDHVTIISNSWAYCEDQTTQADVDSIDTIFQNAATAGISVFNGAGDSGSACLDGSPNTISVPADSPNATAVGGSSYAPGPGYSYGTETWWNDATTSPPAGQGGFGTSRFFSAPPYQSGFASGMRSIPDVVSNADPFHGVEICQADNGGCPNGKQYGGTSMSAPAWAAYTALLNEADGTNLGFANPVLYPLANSGAFHNAAALSSDFSHVGLGSPDLNAMYAGLSHQTAGAVDGTVSEVTPTLQNWLWPAGAPDPSGEPADGTSQTVVNVHLYDSNGIAVSGKTVTLAANGGNQATIAPSSGVSDSNGGVLFTVTDSTPENLTLTATDTTDGITIGEQPSLPFVTPVAAQAGLNAFPSTVTADGATPVDITVTLEDSKSNPSPGKTVQIVQTGGNSVITGPIPPVTDSNGMIEFTAVDSNNETITYSAVDVTDGNLAFPETGMVTFDSAPEPGCSNTVVAAPGFVATPYASGFLAQNFSFGNINVGGCPGVYGMAFDSSGNFYAGDEVNGNLYKFPSTGGVAGDSYLLSTLGPTLGRLVFDSSGNLYSARDATTGDFTTGAVFQIDPTTGAIIRTVASSLTCASPLSIDSISGDLFTDDSCYGAGADNADLWRISGLDTDSPTTAVYATMPTTPNGEIDFAPGGTIYVNEYLTPQEAVVTGTNSANPGQVSTFSLPIYGGPAFGMQTNGDAQYLIATYAANTNITPNTPETVGVADLTVSPPTAGAPIIANGGGSMITGPGGCIYVGAGVAVWKITDTNGECNYTASNPAPSLSLNPTSFADDAAQGSPISLTATLHFAPVAAGTPVTFQINGANAQTLSSSTDSSGNAILTYIGAHQGTDTITASVTVSDSSVLSNQAVVTWGPGTDVTFLTLNGSPESTMPGQSVMVKANLSDVSTTPASTLSGQTVNFAIGGEGCEAATDSNGNASCAIAPSGAGIMTLTGNFAATSQYNASSDSKSFNIVAPEPTPTPVAGKLKIQPSRLNFGSVTVGSSKMKTLKIANGGKITKKKTASPIVIEAQSATPDAFAVTMNCQQQLGPKSKGVAPGTCIVEVTFTPSAAMKYTGNLVVYDNVDPSQVKKYPPLMQTVPMTGTGKAPK
ncbi:MAG: Ig-like domain-containing protein [Candidatus Binataceae bacterium]